MRAQSSRGVEFSTGPYRARLRAIVSLLVPLFVSAFKRAEELAIAMEARGYNGSVGRTRYRVQEMRGADYLVIVSIILFAMSLYLLR